MCAYYHGRGRHDQEGPRWTDIVLLVLLAFIVGLSLYAGCHHHL